jgi:outer membrane protein TolC
MLATASTAAICCVGSIFVGGCSITPQPLGNAELSHLADGRVSQMAADQEPVSGQLTLYEAMARALKYNLDYRIEMMQQSLRGAESALAASDMLPKLVTNAGWAGRDSYLSSAHLDLTNGNVTPPRSISSDKDQLAGDITFSWNILDFALSYARAKQASDKYLIAEAAKRKVIHRILEDTRTAYWRAISADRMVTKLRRLEGRLTKAIAGSRYQLAEGATSPMTALTYERELVQIKVKAEQLQRELTLAKSQLAALMNVAPGTAFSLADQEDPTLPNVMHMNVTEMMAEALYNRPELREVAYKRRINETEATAAVLEVLPGLRLYTSANGDNNAFLLNNNWVSMGASAALNLMKIVSLPARQRAIDAQDVLLDQQGLAATMVVMTQVHVSRIRYRLFAEELSTAQDYNAVQAKLLGQIRAEVTAGTLSEQTLIREEMNALLAEVRRDIAYTNVQNAAANIFVSMGLDLQAQEVDHSLDVKALADHLKRAFGNRMHISERGRHVLAAKTAPARRADASRLGAPPPSAPQLHRTLQ